MATSGSETTKGRGGSRIKRSTAAKKKNEQICALDSRHGYTVLTRTGHMDGMCICP